MPEHVLISCNQCQRGLRVRVNYLGQSVGCNHCGHLFVAEVSEDFNSARTSVASSTSVRLARRDLTESPITSTVQNHELIQLKEDRLRLKTENDLLASRLATATYQRLSLQLRAEDLESQLQRALEHVQLIQDELAGCEVGRSEIDRLRIESYALQEKAMHTLRLEEELQRLQEHTEEQRVEHEEKLTRATRERDLAVSQLAEVKRDCNHALSDPERAAHCGGIRASTQPGRSEGGPLVE